MSRDFDGLLIKWHRAGWMGINPTHNASSSLSVPGRVGISQHGQFRWEYHLLFAPTFFFWILFRSFSFIWLVEQTNRWRKIYSASLKMRPDMLQGLSLTVVSDKCRQAATLPISSLCCWHIARLANKGANWGLMSRQIFWATDHQIGTMLLFVQEGKFPPIHVPTWKCVYGETI